VNDTSFLDPLFRRWERRVTLSEDNKQAMAAMPWGQRSYTRDNYLIREGEPALACTLLLDGFVFRQKLVSDGARQIISFHIAGDFIDLQNAMLDVSDHNVQSLGSSTVVGVPKNAVLDLMAANPAIQRALWLDSLIDASIFREWVVNVGRRDARTRIAHLMCEVAVRLDRAGDTNGSIYQFPMTQEQVADATGLTAVHTNRVLQSLRKDGLITLAVNRLTILDWNALAEVGDFSELYLHYRQ
jgi:CRP-like cAMP-binding protein